MELLASYQYGGPNSIFIYQLRVGALLVHAPDPPPTQYASTTTTTPSDDTTAAVVGTIVKHQTGSW